MSIYEHVLLNLNSLINIYIYIKIYIYILYSFYRVSAQRLKRGGEYDTSRQLINKLI